MNKTRIISVILLAVGSLLSLGAARLDDDVSGSGKKVYVFPIHEMIEPALAVVLQRGLSEAKDWGADLVVFDIDTPGGRIDATETIMRSISEVEVPTITLVNKDAISAGAIISLSTDAIYMTPGSKVGDAMPIRVSLISGGVKEIASDHQEKMVSFVAGMVRAAAQEQGHDPMVAECMVRRELEYKIGEEIVCKEGELLTLTNQEAEKQYEEGVNLFSAGTVKDLDDLMGTLNITDYEVKRFKSTSAETLARLVQGPLAQILMMAGLLGLYIEFKTPGLGLPGLLGVICLMAFFWGHHLAGLAGKEEVLLFLLGVALLGVEIFVLPGFGIFGISGLCIIMVSLFTAMIQHAPGMPVLPSWTIAQVPLVKMGTALTGTLIIGALLSRVLPKSKIFQRLILAEETSKASGYVAATEHKELEGAEGVAETVLKLSGTALINGEFYAVVSNTSYIDKGTPIRVLEVHGNRIVVDRVNEEG